MDFGGHLSQYGSIIYHMYILYIFIYISVYICICLYISVYICICLYIADPNLRWKCKNLRKLQQHQQLTCIVFLCSACQCSVVFEGHALLKTHEVEKNLIQKQNKKEIRMNANIQYMYTYTCQFIYQIISSKLVSVNNCFNNFPTNPYKQIKTS